MNPLLVRRKAPSEHVDSLPLQLAVLLLLGTVRDPQHEVDDDGQQEDDGEHGGPETVIKPCLPPHSYRLRSPVVRHQRIDHGQHGHAGEEEGRDEGGPVAEVEHADGEGAEDDGEVEP